MGGSSELTNLAVVERICQVMDQAHPRGRPHNRLISFVKDRPGHDKRYAIDAAKIEKEIGWKAHESFETGIRKTVDWYLCSSAWWQPLRSGVYGGERLGLLTTDAPIPAGTAP